VTESRGKGFDDGDGVGGLVILTLGMARARNNTSAKWSHAITEVKQLSPTDRVANVLPRALYQKPLSLSH
jgi:hypothetical protein